MSAIGIATGCGEMITVSLPSTSSRLMPAAASFPSSDAEGCERSMATNSSSCARSIHSRFIAGGPVKKTRSRSSSSSSETGVTTAGSSPLSVSAPPALPVESSRTTLSNGNERSRRIVLISLPTSVSGLTMPRRKPEGFFISFSGCFERLGEVRLDAARREGDRPEPDERSGDEVSARADEPEFARPPARQSDDQREREEVHQRALFLQRQTLLAAIADRRDHRERNRGGDDADHHREPAVGHGRRGVVDDRSDSECAGGRGEAGEVAVVGLTGLHVEARETKRDRD